MSKSIIIYFLVYGRISGEFAEPGKSDNYDDPKKWSLRSEKIHKSDMSQANIRKHFNRNEK
jgi:hypothetical protein